MKHLILILTILLTSCVHLRTPESNFNWVRSDRPALPMTIHTVSQTEVQKHCPKVFLPIACAVMYKNLETGQWLYCKVYTRYQKLPEDIVAHEKKHCDGWDH